jgi:succinyl-CoA synthetase alpha subunit
MSILLDQNTRVLVQGITGRDGSFHAKQMLEYGTRVVGGVTPGKGGQEIHGVPVFDSMGEAVKAVVTPRDMVMRWPPASMVSSSCGLAAPLGWPMYSWASSRVT